MCLPAYMNSGKQRNGVRILTRCICSHYTYLQHGGVVLCLDPQPKLDSVHL